MLVVGRIAQGTLVAMSNPLQVSDFGLAKRADDFRPTGLPYPLTTAPEVLRNMEDTSIWTTKSDVWQFGLLICEVCPHVFVRRGSVHLALGCRSRLAGRRCIPSVHQMWEDHSPGAWLISWADPRGSTRGLLKETKG